MFDFLRGRIAEKGATSVVVEVGGIGYRAEVSLRTSAELPGPGSEALLLVHHKVQDDRFRLFGFCSLEERELFLALTSVPGVGPAHALGLLSRQSPAEIWGCLSSKDAVTLSRAKGIGPRIAQRLCTELADLGTRRQVRSALISREETDPGVLEDAISALLALGYKESQAQKAVEAVLRQKNPPREVQEILRQALGNP